MQDWREWRAVINGFWLQVVDLRQRSDKGVRVWADTSDWFAKLADHVY